MRSQVVAYAAVLSCPVQTVYLCRYTVSIVAQRQTVVKWSQRRQM